MSAESDELRNMILNFRVSELQMLLGFAGRNKSGRKNDLQQRALELLRVRSHPVHLKIRELYKTIQQSGALNNAGAVNPAAAAAATAASVQKDMQAPPTLTANLPQQQSIPQATVHPYRTVPPQRQTQQQQQPMYTQQSMYNYAQTQYAPQKPIQPAFPIHPDVRFKRLPFYDVIADLIKPSSLMPQTSQRMQEHSFFFHLTPQQATDIASNRDIRCETKIEYVKQVQLRFCLLETSCEQEDFFPPSIIVKVNNKLCPLPNPIPTNKPGVDPKRPPRPVNITPLVKLNPNIANTISVSWAAEYGRGYVMSVMLVHKLTSSELLQRLKQRGVKHSDYTRGLIKEKLSEDADCEIRTTSLRVSLMCPLGKLRMSTPCRSSTCQHLQCFDASLFLQMNERKPTWNCPVCDKPALYDHLVIDGYFQDVLASSTLPNDTNEIQLHSDGSWSTHVVMKKETKIESTLDESVQIIDDDVIAVVPDEKVKKEECSSNSSTSITTTSTSEKKNSTIVDLTLSDSEDEQPLQQVAQKRKNSPKPDSTNALNDSTASVISSTSSVLSAAGSVSSSGYQSPNVITLDSPSPPISPNANRPACMMDLTQANNYLRAQQTMANSVANLYNNIGKSMPYLDLDDSNNSQGGGSFFPNF